MCKYLLFFFNNDSNLSNVTASASFDLEKLNLEMIKTAIKVTDFKYIFLVSSPKNSNCVMKKIEFYILYKYVPNIALQFT